MTESSHAPGEGSPPAGGAVQVAAELRRRVARVDLSCRLARVGAGLGTVAAGAAFALLILALLATAWLPSDPVRRALLLSLLALAMAVFVHRVLAPLIRRPNLVRAALLVEQRHPELRDRLAAVVDDSPYGFGSSLFSAGLQRRAVLEAAALGGDANFGAAVDWRPTVRSALVALAGLLLLGAVASAAPDLLRAVFLGPPAQAAPSARPGALAAPPARRGAKAGPMLGDVALEVVPPAYSGLPDSRQNGLPDQLSALVGTRLVLTGTVADPRATVTFMAQAEARSAAPAASPANLTGNHFRAEITVRRSGQLWLQSALDTRTWDSPRCQLAAQPDLAPQVQITRPGHSEEWTESRALDLTVRAADDFGVQDLWLEYHLQKSPQWLRQYVKASPGREVEANLNWDLRPLNLQPGDELVYRAAARDNDAVSGPKIGHSALFRVSLRKPTTVEAQRELRQAEDRERSALEKLRDRADDLQKQLEELDKSLRANGSAEQRERQKAELREAQKELERLGQDLEQALRDTEKEAQAQGNMSEATAEKLRQLHDLMREAIQGKLQEAFRQVENAVQAQRPEEMREAVQEARDTQKEVLDRLDQAISLLKRLQLQARLERAAELAERLADQQDKLAQRGQAEQEKPRPSPEELQAQARDQQQLGTQAEHLQQETKQIAQEAQEQQAPGAEKLTQLQDQMAQQPPAQSMQRATERLQAADSRGAQRPQQQAQQQLRQMAAQFNQALSQMSGAAMRQLQEGVSGAVQEALELSQEQGRVLGDTQRLARSQVRVPQPAGQYSAEQKRRAEELARQQAAVAQGTRRLGQTLGKLAEQTQLLDPALAAQLSELGDRMDQAQRELSGAAPSAAAERQRGALADLNEMARELLSMTQQAGQQAQQMAMDQVMQLLRALAQQQRNLNQQTQRLGGQQGARPGQGGQPGGPQAGDLAAWQQQLRDALQRMLGQGPGQGLADQLGQAPGQMDDITKDLQQQKVTQRTLRTQEDVLHRMLDAQRSIHEKEQRQHERKAERPKPYQPPPSPPELTLAQKGKPATAKTPALPPEEALPLGFEDLVRGYFRALLRQEGAGR